jgi:hypothetical protein
MKYVLFYETAPEAAPRIPIFYPAHSTRSAAKRRLGVNGWDLGRFSTACTRG